MTLEELGRKLKLQYPRYSSLTDDVAGRLAVETYPRYRQLLTTVTVIEKNDRMAKYGLPTIPKIPDRISVADHEQKLINLYNPTQMGMGAWWNSLGESSRLKLAKLMADRAEQLNRLQRAVDEAEAVKMLKAFSLWTKQVEALIYAAKANYTIQDEDHKLVQLEDTKLLERNAIYKGLTVESDQELLVEAKRSEIKVKEHRKMEEVTFEFKQKEIEAEVAGILRLHNTSELTRQQNIEILKAYNKDVLLEQNPANKLVYQREIDRLMKELYPDAESFTMASQETFGQEPEGGNTPPQSGSQSQSASRNTEQSNTATGLGNVN